MPLTRIVQRARILDAKYMPDVCTNSRTLAALAVRVRQFTAQLHVEGTSNYLRIHEWLLSMPYGSDVKRADKLTVTSSTLTYIALDINSPESYSVVVAARCALLSFDGSGLPVASDAIVTFSSPTEPAPTGNIPVYIRPSAWMAAIDPEAAKFQYTCVTAVDVKYPSGHLLSAGDLIHWSLLPGGKAVISQPVVDPGLIPFQMFYFFARDTGVA